jgi:hypothetical protein
MRASVATGRQHDKIDNFAAFKNGTVLATEGELHQTEMYTRWQ